MTTTRNPTGASLVEVTGLRKSFGPVDVLRGIDFTIAPGEVTVLLGPSGSGKTTILRSLNALDLPDAGLVRIGQDAVDFAQLRRGRHGHAVGESARQVASLRSHSGMVFQQHNLFGHRSVLANVIEGPVQVQKVPRAEAEATARDLLAQVGLADQADKYPHQLSGGQQQRVGIARALAQRPDLLLFDEPTSALDPELVGEVLGAMRRLAEQGRTMLVVTHEIAFARRVADQVLFIDGGLLVEQGSPAQVIDDPEQPRTRSFLHRILDPLA